MDLLAQFNEKLISYAKNTRNGLNYIVTIIVTIILKSSKLNDINEPKENCMKNIDLTGRLS